MLTARKRRREAGARSSRPYKLSDVKAIHQRCGVYTESATASKLLDWVRWSVDEDLRNSTLLEPCCGDGAIVVPAVERLCRSLLARGLALSRANLAPRIRAYEFHSAEARKARAKVRRVLMEVGVRTQTADALVNEWIRTHDFLLVEPSRDGVTHVVANPPYVRWSSLPSSLARAYESVLPKDAARGDLCLAFLDRMSVWARSGAPLAVLVSDRWLYSAYAEAYRRNRSATLCLERHEDAKSSAVFQERVYTYPALLLLRRTAGTDAEPGTNSFTRPSPANSLFQVWATRFGSLEEAQCTVRVGPALGHDAAFVIGAEELSDVEPDRCFPFVGPREISATDEIAWRGRKVLVVNEGANLIPLSKFPKARRRLNRFRTVLERRSCVRGTHEAWYRTIDRIVPDEWLKPKLLVPELAKRPRVGLDRSGLVPSHGVYAIFSREWPINALHAVLCAGVLGVTLNAIAPKVNSGCLRSYKKFLVRVPLPRWDQVPEEAKASLLEALAAGDRLNAHETIARLYDVDPGELRQYASDGWNGQLGSASAGSVPAAARRVAEDRREAVREPACQTTAVSHG